MRDGKIHWRLSLYVEVEGMATIGRFSLFEVVVQSNPVAKEWNSLVLELSVVLLKWIIDLSSR